MKREEPGMYVYLGLHVCMYPTNMYYTLMYYKTWSYSYSISVGGGSALIDCLSTTKQTREEEELSVTFAEVKLYVERRRDSTTLDSVWSVFISLVIFVASVNISVLYNGGHSGHLNQV